MTEECINCSVIVIDKLYPPPKSCHCLDCLSWMPFVSMGWLHLYPNSCWVVFKMAFGTYIIKNLRNVILGILTILKSIIIFSDPPYRPYFFGCPPPLKPYFFTAPLKYHQAPLPHKKWTVPYLGGAKGWYFLFMTCSRTTWAFSALFTLHVFCVCF